MYAASSWTRKEIKFSQQSTTQKEVCFFSFLIFKYSDIFIPGLHASPVFGNPYTHLSGTSPFTQNPTYMKKGFTGILFFLLDLKKN